MLGKFYIARTWAVQFGGTRFCVVFLCSGGAMEWAALNRALKKGTKTTNDRAPDSAN